MRTFVAAMYAAAQLQMLDSMASSEDDDEDNAPKLSKRELKRVESKKEARKSDKKAKDDKDKKGMSVGPVKFPNLVNVISYSQTRKKIVPSDSANKSAISSRQTKSSRKTR